MNQNLIETIVFLVAFVALVTGFIFLFSSKTSNLPIVKTFKESATIRVAASGVSILLAWISPWISLKVLLFILSFVLLISIFPIRKGLSSSLSIVLLVLFIMVITVPILGMGLFFNVKTKTIKDNGTKIDIPGIHINIPPITIPNSSNYDLRPHENFLPDKSISVKDIDSISIKVSSEIELELVEGDTLSYPSRLIETGDNKVLHLEEFSPIKNSTYVIKLGTSLAKNLDIDCTSVKIIGSGNIKDIHINSVGTTINADIVSENNIYINTVGFDLNGKLKGKNLNLNTTGSNIKGELDFDKIILDATGVNIDIKSKFNNFNINATSLNGTLEILNTPDETGEFYIDATGGSLKIINKSKAPIDIKNSGIIKLIRE
ncbi:MULTISPECIES: hypothetical protein [Thermoanaerobacter]|jgi:hypothetical protein|uniref:Adhesin domain-containing protein n=2 Tax=Thermoanaerobacter TaxID=1754 RepID=B0KCD2_THEP3|nr:MULTISPECIES: hypothetical protein [Thermoanaerobacter]ABY95486.1 hypothetical protein Teth39_1851 [Thermoanaerobacter pseudethanolicus ATCC 33223]ADV80428.1 hypothetical protein Thebr_1899 [Thermoanaerobacter brockii subsp. finnii Ako-1]HBW60739.1 hypothetical protein [Thermoanaerobacter sp.]